MTRLPNARLRALAVVGAAVLAAGFVPASTGARADSTFGEPDLVAILTLLDIWAAQSVAKARAAVDTDGDGVGEYATLRELAGTVPARGRGGAAGARLDPAPLARRLGAVDEHGIAGRAGYGFVVYLPDTSPGGGFTHERGGDGAARFEGGTGEVDPELAESHWCAYAQPVKFGETGTHRYVVDEAGHVFSSEFDTARPGGSGVPFAGDAAFLGATFASGVAAGAKGRDGETWTLVQGATSLATNEIAAIATLRNMASCQAQMQTSGKIDADGDGIGEYGTFLELTGSVGVRRWFHADPDGSPASCDFTLHGTPVIPAIVSQALAGVDATGVVVKHGYVFEMFLPDSARVAGFVHEVGPAFAAALDGGTGRVGVDLSETTWCLYAQPLVRGRTGNRRFFVNQSGDVMQSPNEIARAEGRRKAIDPRSAFLPQSLGITGRIAVGTVGHDGDMWKPTN